MGILVFISVLLVAACGLIYELVAGTLASYLVGNSVFQFSTIIGTYLFAMGLGSALSRYIKDGLANRFVWIELLLGVIGGFSSALLMLAFAFTQGFELILYALGEGKRQHQQRRGKAADDAKEKLDPHEAVCEAVL